MIFKVYFDSNKFKIRKYHSAINTAREFKKRNYKKQGLRLGFWLGLRLGLELELGLKKN